MIETNEQQTVIINPPNSTSSESQTNSDQQVQTALELGQVLEAHRQLQSQFQDSQSKLEILEAQSREAQSQVQTLSQQLSTVLTAIQAAQTEAEEEESREITEVIPEPEPQPEPEVETEAEPETPKQTMPKWAKWILGE